MKMDEGRYKLCEDLFYVLFNELANFYDLVTGFNRLKENKQQSIFL